MNTMLVNSAVHAKRGPLVTSKILLMQESALNHVSTVQEISVLFYIVATVNYIITDKNLE